ncbi:DUF6519 domain-containing protein [Kinneretia aquatilis]|uniref:DUF6519 domain-containing protein n=1 Tax=Kinneretia aquatilis TaxID=2070761 RepID=UPI001495330C|nr:DUF6519 domain-containing protein [Paucibacter aquatile]WIV96886.1 DUF6519 domain-containing protein [Paucibacter aquatile]
MKADLTRSTDRPDQHYRAVRMQQGRVQLDAEWNEQQDILNRRIETETVDSLGAGAAVPIDAAGFLLTGAGENISISAGRCYVQGLLCEAATGQTLITQPGLASAISPVLPTQPAGQSLLALPPAQAAPLSQIRVYNAAGAAVAPSEGVYIGYVEAWLRHITPLEAPHIREVALGLPDTSTRDQLVWQVKLLRAGDVGTPLSCLSVEPWASFSQAPDGRMAARAEPTVPPKDPCLLTPEAGYRRLENQLYRVEIHDDGSISGKPRFKWSRDNGSIATRVTRWLGEPTANEFEVASLGRDASLSIQAGSWIEFYSELHEQTGQPGTLVQVLKTAGTVVTVDLSSKTGPLDKGLFSVNPRVRRWEGWGQINSAAPNTNTGWVELEDGVELKFAPGRYRVGDFWQIPARTATADIEWPLDSADKPRFLAPLGVLRAFARLAVLRYQGNQWTRLHDCRQLFPSLSELRNLVYVGGDGQQIAPNPIAPAPVPLPRPLEVAVFNGQFPVAGARVRFTASHGQLPGGGLVAEVDTGPDGLASVSWALSPTVLSQTCSAELLEAGAPAAGKFNRIHFNASLLTAAQVAYDPSNCAEAKAAQIHTVQEALDALCKRGHGGGCSKTVGEGGDFATLDEAIERLINEKQRDIVLCLLPGDHHLKDGIDVQAPSGTRLHVHGAGQASRLFVQEQEFNLFNFASVELDQFELVWSESWASLRIEGCSQVRLSRLGLSGFTPKGLSLLQIAGASALEISACRIKAYTGEGLPARLKQVFELLPDFKPLQSSFEVKEGRVFEPLDLRVAEAYAQLSAAQRKSLGAQIANYLRKSDTGALALAPEEREALQQFQRELQDEQVPAQQLLATLERWRVGVLLSQGGSALTLADARADTLLADNLFHGQLALYGDASLPEFPQALFQGLSQALKAGRVSLAHGNGRLRLRNNRLRGVRLADEWVQRIDSLIKNGGVLDGCYRSLVGDANIASALSLDLLAYELSLSTTAFERNDDVGVVIADQGKYLGNFAHNDFRLFAFGHVPEKFGNGPLNIVAA